MWFYKETYPIFLCEMSCRRTFDDDKYQKCSVCLRYVILRRNIPHIWFFWDLLKVFGECLDFSTYFLSFFEFLGIFCLSLVTRCSSLVNEQRVNERRMNSFTSHKRWELVYCLCHVMMFTCCYVKWLHSYWYCVASHLFVSTMYYIMQHCIPIIKNTI